MFDFSGLEVMFKIGCGLIVVLLIVAILGWTRPKLPFVVVSRATYEQMQEAGNAN